MNFKQKKYFDIINTYQIFQNNKDNFFLIVHVNNLNSVESLQIKNYCVQNKITTLSVKLNLLKKITKNSLFINLLSGPTKIFFFSDLTSLFDFVKIVHIKKKIIPLSIYWKNNFYNYSFIETYLKNNFLLEKDSNIGLKNNQIELVKSLNKTNIDYIYNGINNINTLIYILNIIIKK